MSSNHAGGMNGAFMDGSVHFISDTIESATIEQINAIPDIRNTGNVYKVWQNLCVINDGDPIGEF